MTDKHEMRRASEYEGYVEITPTTVEDAPDAHNVWLKVGVQRFRVTPHGVETQAEAEWMRDMLCIALDKVARERLAALASGHQHTPILPTLSDSALAAHMRAHVISRGGLSHDAKSGDINIPNGAWAMMLEAAERLEGEARE